MKYTNPVIPGFYPDPSVCRVGDAYYLVTSTFEYFPGVPVFHSRDLVHWTQIGHCLTRESQLPLEAARPSGGIYAPTIRHIDGTFYMITTNTSHGGNFFVTADDPAGEWSEPVWVKQSGIDPSLFRDDDGKVYIQGTGGAEGIQQSEIDLSTGKLRGRPKIIWSGTGGICPEAPHLYKINGVYYLMIAEGGTEYGHMETIARADNPWGPFEPCPHNPILTQKNTLVKCRSIQGTGHADLVQAHDGSWWLVFLGFRPAVPKHQMLGRETFLAPVTWTDDGWPMVYPREGAHAGIYGVEIEMEADLPPQQPTEPEPPRDDFDEPRLRLCWNLLRNPDENCWSVTERPGWLRLNGSGARLGDVASPAFVGRRQQHFDFLATALLDFEPGAEGDEAGLTVLMNNKHHYDIAVGRTGSARRVFVRRRIGDLAVVVAERDLPAAGAVHLRIAGSREEYAFSVSTDGEQFDMLATAATRYLSKEVAGGFTGVYLGMYATGNGRPCTAPADFDWFDYRPGKD
jgi:alpha-N-arabinofuranosidase